MSFWDEQPAFLLGLSFLIGVGATLFGLPVWIAALWLAYVLLLRKWTAGVVVALAAAYAWGLHGHAPEVSGELPCTGRFAIHRLQTHQSPFHRDLVYRGALYLDGQKLPCSITAHPGKRVAADCDYMVSGVLRQRAPFDYVFKAKEWTPVAGTWSLAELRHKSKERLKAFLSAHLKRPRTADLLFSLSSGEVEDRRLRYEFGRLGLQHILAISGFHFGVLVGAVSLALGLFLPLRWKWGAMLLVTTAYFVFIGSTPAVERAWIGSTLFVLAKLFRRPVRPVNLLGAALLIELVVDPLVAANLGFQLSFASCLGILLLHPWFSEQLARMAPKRPRDAALTLGERCVAMSAAFFRSGLSLTLAVNAVILPLLLLHFGKFPWLSLVYNLFYPLLVSGALVGLMVALAVGALAEPLSVPLFAVVDWWTEQLVQLVAYPPVVLDRSLYVKELPVEVVVVYLLGILLWAVHGKEQEVGVLRA